jgi:predicted Zn finger-like uncharacterized protein
MKVVCDGCSTKYSIEDDKVAGRMFKVRCRRCGRVNVLRADAAPAAAAAAAAGATGAAAATAAAAATPAWHAVRDGEQIGPFDSGELLRRRDAGELDDGSYVWREGFAEWLPLGTVGELRELAPVATVVTPMPARPAPIATVVDPLPPRSGTIVGPAPDRDTASSRLHGERGETSLLFSLNGLSKQAVPAAPVAPAAPARSGAVGGEGSGLIDIRGLARSYAPTARPTEARVGATSAPASRTGSSGEFPMFSSGAFLAPSVVVPAPPQRDQRLVAGLAAVFGLLAICTTLLVVIVLSRRGQEVTADREAPAPRVAKMEPRSAPHAPSPAVVEPPSSPVSSPSVPSVPPSVPVSSPSVPPSVPAPSPASVPPSPSVRAPATPSRTPATQVRTPATQVRTPAPPTTTPTPAPTPAAKCDQVTCVVNGFDSECCRALQNGGLRPPTPTPDRTPLADSLDRAAINEGLATISTKRCSNASAATGLVKAHVKVSPAGAVTSVTVDGSPDAALAACVVEQAQRGRFKPTQRGGSFAYVWRF